MPKNQSAAAEDRFRSNADAYKNAGSEESFARSQAIIDSVKRQQSFAGTLDSVSAHTQAGLEVGTNTFNTAVERGKEKFGEGKEALIALRNKGGEVIDNSVIQAREKFEATENRIVAGLNSVGERYSQANANFENAQIQAGEQIQAGCDSLRQMPAKAARSLWTGGKAYLKRNLAEAGKRATDYASKL